MKEKQNLLERRRAMLRQVISDSRAIEAILLERGDQLEYERQHQITLDREAELMEVESEIQSTPRDIMAVAP